MSPWAGRLVFGLVLVAAAVGSWWLTRAVEPPASTQDARTRHDPDYRIHDFHAVSLNERGERRYVLEAKRLVHYPDDDTAHLTEPYLVQFPDNGGAAVHTRAERGVMPGDGREIVMTGNVRSVRGADPRSAGGELLTERLRVELDRSP